MSSGLDKAGERVEDGRPRGVRVLWPCWAGPQRPRAQGPRQSGRWPTESKRANLGSCQEEELELGGFKSVHPTEAFSGLEPQMSRAPRSHRRTRPGSQALDK